MAQTLVKLYVHIVFSTKHRVPSILSEIEVPLHRYMTGIVQNTGSKLVRIGGMQSDTEACCCSRGYTKGQQTSVTDFDQKICAYYDIAICTLSFYLPLTTQVTCH